MDNYQEVATHSAYTKTWLSKRQSLLNAGGFDEKLRVWDDWDLLLRLSKEMTLVTVAYPLVVARQTHDSISKDSSRFIHDMQLMLVKHKDTLSGYSAEYAGLHYVLALYLIHDGCWDEARKVLREVIGLNRWHWKSWLLLIVSLVSKPAALRMIQGGR